jgi:hypothetical protein
MSIPLTNYKVNGVDLFLGITGPGQPVGATGYNAKGTNLFTYYTNQGANYQSNLSGFNYIYQGTPFDIMLYNYFSKAIIGTPANATFNNINGRLCWKIINNTTIIFNFPNATTIKFVAVGGGQSGVSGSGGDGGGTVTGNLSIPASIGVTLTILIGAAQSNTTMRAASTVNVNITANSGTNSGSGGSATGNYVSQAVISLGGSGGAVGTAGKGSNGGAGQLISDLAINVAGGGGGAGSQLGAFGWYPYGFGGSTGGGNGSGSDFIGNKVAQAGTANTGGGGGGGLAPLSSNAVGGSGVVYLYL